MLAIHAVPAFKDNYIWVLEDGRHAVAVDPGDAAPVQAFLESRGLATVLQDPDVVVLECGYGMYLHRVDSIRIGS